MIIETRNILVVIGAMGLSSCALYDPDRTAAWERPVPGTPASLGDDEAPMPAADFVDPAEQIQAALLALERMKAVPRPAPSPEETAGPAVVAGAENQELEGAVPALVPPAPPAKVVQPPVVVHGSGMADPGSVGAPPEPRVSQEVAEIRTGTVAPAEHDTFGPTLTLEPVFDAPPSLDYGIKLSEDTLPFPTGE